MGDYTLRVVALGAAALGVVAGALGTYAVLRRQSLFGDAVSHAALPGIALAFLLTRSKEPLVLVVGAAAAGWLAALLVMGVVRGSRVKYDSALGLVTFVFFGVGLVLLTYLQKQVKDAGQAGLDRFLFGQAATLLLADVGLVLALGGVALLLMLLFWKEFKLLCFDPDFAASVGYPVRALDVLLTSLIVVAIVIGLQTVGVVLMSALLIAPAAAARQWTDRHGRMVLLAAAFGGAVGVAGAVLSSEPRWWGWLDAAWDGLFGLTDPQRVRLRQRGSPTGPVIVLCAGVVVLGSLLLAPNRGLLWNAVRRWRNRRHLRLGAVLAGLYELGRQHPGAEHGHSVAVLQAMGAGDGGVLPALRALEARGLARRAGDGWALTAAGRAEAERLAAAGQASSAE